MHFFVTRGIERMHTTGNNVIQAIIHDRACFADSKLVMLNAFVPVYVDTV